MGELTSVRITTVVRPAAERHPTTIDLPFTGSYDFAASITMAAGASFVEPLHDVDGQPPRRVLDLAFPLEGTWQPVAVRIEQSESGQVAAELVANPDGATTADVRDQLSRILSLDTDGQAFGEVGARDPAVATLQQRFPGLRPVQINSPYECAARAIIQHRLSFRQAARITDRIAADHGTALSLDSRLLHTFPAPAQLATLTAVPGLAERKTSQLRALGEAARDGAFTADRLRSMPHDDAMTLLQRSPGIGPFSAELVLIRGAGHPDVFPATEKSLHRAMAEHYHLEEPDLVELARIAEGWRPYRSWAGLLLRHLVE